MTSTSMKKFFDHPRATPLALAAAAAAVSGCMLLHARRKSYSKTEVHTSSVRKVGRTSHIHIETVDVETSTQFFEAFGLSKLSSNEQFTILSCPTKNKKKHEPYIVLEKVNRSSSNTTGGTCTDVGVGRLCFGVKDVYEIVQLLRDNRNMEPISPPVCDRPGSPDENGINKEGEVVIVAYRDPASGVVLELVSLKMTTVLRGIIGVAQTLLSLEFPLFVHVNINTSNYSCAMEAYQAVGYSKINKYYGRVVNSLYKALEIPDPGIAKEVTLIKMPEEELFSIDLIEWEDPATTKPKDVAPSNIRIGVTVKDLPNQLDAILLKNALDGNDKTKSHWNLSKTPKFHSLPSPMGKTLVASIQDPDGLEMDLVEYPMKLSGVDVPADIINKVILITGCDSGFGRSLACRMASLGFIVVAACYSDQGATYLSHVATTVVADLLTKEGANKVAKACQTVLQQSEPPSQERQLWAIVNNAAVCYPGNVEWLSPSQYQNSMQVNFHSPVTIIHELIQNLKECAGSRIIQVSSVCGMLAQPTNSAYCATKHALESYSDALRCELLPYGVKVCVVQPATMRTPLGISYWDSWYKGYKEAPASRQTSFLPEKLEGFVEKSRAQLKDAAEDPNVTVVAMVKALLELDPPTRLRTGAAANLFFRPVSQLPDSTRDNLLWSILGLDSVHAVPRNGKMK